jgi:hypothetical protein
VTDTQATSPFRLAYVPGVTPTKWVKVWNERLPEVPLTLLALPASEGGPALQQGGADAGLVRLPVDRTVLSAIPLYTELSVPRVCSLRVSVWIRPQLQVLMSLPISEVSCLRASTMALSSMLSSPWTCAPWASV